MSQPQLTFACELDPARLTDLFADGAVIEDLQALGARVIMMVSDLTNERAAVVKQLNEADIALVGVPLFPAEEGYYFTVENAPRAAARYEQWKAWSAEHELRWEWVGLDIEPEAKFYARAACGKDFSDGCARSTGAAPSGLRAHGRTQGVRRLLRAVLWSSAHQPQAGLLATGLALLLRLSRKDAQSR